MFHIFWGRSFIRPHMSFCLNPIRLEFAIFLRLNFPRYLKTFSYLSVMWRKMIKSRSSLGNGLLLFTQQVVSSAFKGVLKKTSFRKSHKVKILFLVVKKLMLKILFTLKPSRLSTMALRGQLLWNGESFMRWTDLVRIRLKSSNAHKI